MGFTFNPSTGMSVGVRGFSTTGVRLSTIEQFEPATFLSNSGLVSNVMGFRAKDIIFSQGDPADAVFFIQAGKVKLTVVSSEGKEATIALLGACEFLGEACVTGQVSRRMSTAQAVSDCMMLRISRSAMADVIRREPRFLDFFLSFILARNLRMQEDLIAQLFDSSEKRLARILLLLAAFDDPAQEQAQIPRISHEALAEMVGTTRSRVSFFMNRFRRQGHVAYGNESRADLLVRRSLAGILLNDPACEHCSDPSSGY
jgi:CRP-like cAMP-binding protein